MAQAMLEVCDQGLVSLFILHLCFLALVFILSVVSRDPTAAVPEATSFLRHE